MAQPPPPRVVRVAILVNDDAPKWAGETERLWRDAIAGDGAACDGGDFCRAGAADADKADGAETAETAPSSSPSSSVRFEFRDYDCAGRGEVPTADELCRDFDAVIVGGSRFSVYGPGPAEEGGPEGWLAREERALAAAAGRADGPRMLGACFGAQLLGKALGGEVGPNPGGRFVLGVEAQAEEAPGPPPPLLRALRDETAAARRTRRQTPASDDQDDERGGNNAGDRNPGRRRHYYRLLQSHGDQVLRLPPGAIPLLSSPTAKHELWLACRGRVLAAQGHAEFSRGAAAGLILPALRASGQLGGGEAARAERSLTEAGGAPDSAGLRAVMRRFLAGEFVEIGGGGEEREDNGEDHGEAAAAAAAAARRAAAAREAAAAAAREAAAQRQAAAAGETEAAADALLSEVSAGLSARAAALGADYRSLEATNRAAAASASRAADVAGALASFADVLGGRRAAPLAAAGAALARLPRALDALEARVAGLEAASLRLEARLRARALKQQQQQQQQQAQQQKQQQQQQQQQMHAGLRRVGGPAPPSAAAAAANAAPPAAAGASGSFLRRLGLM